MSILLNLPVIPRDVAPIRSSAAATWDECHRKYLWKERFGLTNSFYAEALSIGHLTHVILGAMYNGYTFAEGVSIATKTIQDRESDLCDLMDENGILPGGQTVIGILESIRRDLSMAKVMADAFVSRYPLVTDPYEVLGTEVYIEVRAKFFEAPIAGAIDVLIRNKDTGDLIIVDTKTTSQDALTRATRCTIDPQAGIFYRFLVRALAGHYASEVNLVLPGPNGFDWMAKIQDAKVDMVVHNIIQKPTIRFSAKKDQGRWENYLDRARAWYVEQEHKNVNEPPVRQSWTRYDDDPWKTGYTLFEELDCPSSARLDQSVGPLDMFRKTADVRRCQSPGQSKCPFLPLCQSDDPASRPGMWPDQVGRFHQHFRDAE